MATAKGLPLIGVAPALLKNPLQTLAAAAKEGDVVRLNLPGVKLFLIHHPEHVKQVLANDEVYIKGNMAKPFKHLFGTSVLTTEGADWKRHRTLVQPAFHRQHFDFFASIFRDESLRMLDRWAALPGTTPEIDCIKEMKYTSQSIIVKSLFGTDLHAINEHDIDEALEEVFSSLFRMIWSNSLPEIVQRLTGGKAKSDHFKHGMHVLHDTIARLIEIKTAEEAGAAERHDLLDLLLQAHYEDGSAVTHEQIRDEVITFFIAGHDTTSVVLAWAWIAIARNPAIRARLHEELDRIDHAPSLEDLPNLAYTRCVFYEALRTGPPAWFIPRTAHIKSTIDGTEIPAGSIVLVSPYLAHRHPTFWPDPDVFDPERFRENLRNPANFMPFGYGSRQCIAKEFALMEGPLILANVAKRYQLDLKYPDPIEPNPGMSLNPKYKHREGIPMIIRPR